MDLAISLATGDLDRFRQVLSDLKAVTVAVPSLKDLLQAGHAIHFRCAAEGVVRLRIDVMSVFRGLPDFETLWERRTTIETEERSRIELMSLPDLVQAKTSSRQTAACWR